MGRRSRDARSLILVFASTACAGASEHIVLTPGLQSDEEAVVDVQAGSVTQEKEGVVLRVQGVMLPAPRGETPHPTFWVTVENRTAGRITVTPGDARLVDTFGEQHAPLSMSTGGPLDQDVRYALVDPEIHTYVALRFGWPYYPIYPYRGWFPHWRFGTARYWHYDPYWQLGLGPVWIWEIQRRPPPPPRERPRPSREETIYRDARLTYVVTFPEMPRTVREMRLIVPDIRMVEQGDVTDSVDFEVVFNQIVEVVGGSDGVGQ